jgi:hypothetical protein
MAEIKAHWEDDRKAFGDVNDSDIESQDLGQGVMTGGHLNEDEDEFKPTQNEILEYAQFLGMDIVQDEDLLYIAEEGVSSLFKFKMLNLNVVS